MKSRATVAGIVWVGIVVGLASVAQGVIYLPVYGGPTYDPATSTGFQGNWAEEVNSSGLAVGNAEKFASGADLGNRAVRWDALGPAVELGNLGTDGSGWGSGGALGVNAAGTAVGYSGKFSGATYVGQRAVRWDAGSATATELGDLGTDITGYAQGTAVDINTSGTAAGGITKYVSGGSMGFRAVRWAAGGTAATELGNLGTNGSGVASSYAYAINDTGTITGHANRYVGGVDKGERAVRWAAGGTVATELDNLGTDGSGVSSSKSGAINSAGTNVGYAEKYVGGIDLGAPRCAGPRAARPRRNWASWGPTHRESAPPGRTTSTRPVRPWDIRGSSSAAF